MYRFSLTLAVLSLCLPAGFAQQSSSSLIAPELLSTDGSPMPNATGGAVTAPMPAPHIAAFSEFAVGVKAGILGAGVEVATPLSYHLNLRAGGNFFTYNDSLTNDGINYAADLRFRSSEASIDWFPGGGGFHISPGALVYNGNQISATANVPSGATFTLNGTTYTSSATTPVTGSASLTFNKAAPKVTMGWGNLIPRSGRHFSVPVEFGFAYVGDPKVALNLAGTACYTYEGVPYCDNVATDPMIQANVTAQQQKLAKDADYARFFPIASLGFAFRL